MKRVKVIMGYAADARFFAEASEIVGYIPKHPEIPSPYCYSPSHTVYSDRGKLVIHVETKHRRYEVFEVTERVMSDEEATDIYVNVLKKEGERKAANA
jgi:hypothetical protein